MRVATKTIFILFWLGSFFNCLQAQMILDTIHVGQVNISVSRDISLAAIQRIEIDSASFATYSNSDLTELLAANTNLIVKSYGQGSMSTISFRGTGASHTKVKWNGMSINSPLTGQVDFSLIPVEFIDKITIKPGSSSVQDHSGGLGGGIHIQNKIQWDTIPHLRFSKEIASFGGNSSFLNYQFGNSKIQSKTRMGFQQSKNNFSFNNTSILPHQESTQINGATMARHLIQELYYKMDHKNFLSLVSWFTWSEREISPNMTRLDNPSFIEDHYQEGTKDLLINNQFRWDHYRKKIHWHFQSGWMIRENHYKLSETNIKDELIHENRYQNISNSFLNQVKLNWSAGKNTKINTSIDFNSHQALIADLSYQIDTNPTRNELLFFAGIHHQLSKKIKAFTFLRSELIDSEFVPFIPAIGVEYLPFINSDLCVNLTASGNYNQPSMNDRYYLPGGNPDLNPEQGYSTEINFNYLSKQKTVEYSLGFYNSIIKNWILWVDTDFGYWTPKNIQKVQAKGIEAAISIRKKWNKSRIQCTMVYNYSSSTYQGDEEENLLVRNQQLIYIPKNGWKVNVNFKQEGFFVNISNSYTGERPIVQSQAMTSSYFAPPLKAFLISNIYIGKQMEYGDISSSIGLRINNLLNSDYQNFKNRPMPGRNFALLFKFSF